MMILTYFSGPRWLSLFFPHAINRCGHVLAAGDHQLPSTWAEKSLCLKLLRKMFGIDTVRNFNNPLLWFDPFMFAKSINHIEPCIAFANPF